MDALDAIDPGRGPTRRHAAACRGPRAEPSPRSLWARLLVASMQAPLAAAGARGAEGVPRSHRRDSPTTCRRERVDDDQRSLLDRIGLPAGPARRTAAKRPKARIENLMELVSAAREYEAREDDASLGGFVDRLSLLSEADEADGAKEARVWLMIDARRQRPRVPDRRRRGHGRRPVPALAIGRGRGRSRRRAAALLRVPHASARAAVLTGAARRRDFRRLSVHRAVALPR